MSTGAVETFPTSIDLETLPRKDEKVCVVSIVGKSKYNAFASKASILNPTLLKDVFKGLETITTANIEEEELECFYDADNHIVYLHYSSLLDSFRLSTLCRRHTSNTAQQYLVEESLYQIINSDLVQVFMQVLKDFHTIWETEEFHYAKTLLLLFCISHIVVLVHPGNSFDTSYVRLFRIFDIMRMKLQPFLSEQLQGFPISKDWYLSARPCSPRVLFVFETTLMDLGHDDSEIKSRSQRNPPMKRLQHSIEDQIYRVLRKSRIITNISNNSLFAVPANQEFVYIYNRRSPTHDPIGYYLLQLRSTSTSNKDCETVRGKSYQTNRRTIQSSPGNIDGGVRLSLNSRMANENSFRFFLGQHIKLAFTKGFDDNVGKRPIPAMFEMASAQTWFSLATKLYHFFFTDAMDSKVQGHFNTMRSFLEVDIRFSENRCSKVLPVAESAYQEGLPTHYTKSYHLSKLTQAKRVFSQLARGPAHDKYLCQLEDACEKYWKSGRQLCEEISLTGNHCVNPLHRLTEQLETEENKHLPVMNHSSQVKTKAACNCGKKQAEKEDPFDHKAANFDFYEVLNKTCCSKLLQIEMPVFKLDTDAVSAQIAPAPVALKSCPLQRDSVKSDITAGVSSLSLALSLGQSGGSDLFGHIGTTSLNPDHSLVDSGHQQDVTLTQPDVEHVTHRQHSTTEYLPDMINTESPPGLLPKFSSWSLCCLGKASSYIYTQGLDLPGFLHGSNLLLPWDIVLKTEKEKWPGLGEANRKGKQKKVQKDQSEMNIRIYIGDEYECPRGHRFFCSGPDKIIKVSSASSIKDNAQKLLTMDMPLYCACHCRSTKGYMAQLMRLYVVIPEAPIRITLNPNIQPGPPSHCPVFHPEMCGPIELSAGGIWVLRLPHIYVGNHSVHTMPSDPQQLSACTLLKGVYSYKEAT